MTSAHGAGRYVQYGCRCDICKRDRADKARLGRLLRAQRAADIPHGTENGYFNYMCRCHACRVAGSRINHQPDKQRGFYDQQGWDNVLNE
jgi:hypothetical protein